MLSSRKLSFVVLKATAFILLIATPCLHCQLLHEDDIVCEQCNILANKPVIEIYLFYFQRCIIFFKVRIKFCTAINNSYFSLFIWFFSQ
jgi:hypothetical protein